MAVKIPLDGFNTEAKTMKTKVPASKPDNLSFSLVNSSLPHDGKRVTDS